MSKDLYEFAYESLCLYHNRPPTQEEIEQKVEDIISMRIDRAYDEYKDREVEDGSPKKTD